MTEEGGTPRTEAQAVYGQRRVTRLSVITNMVPPYRAPVFRALHEQLGPGLEVLLLSEREKNRWWTAQANSLPARVLLGKHLFFPGRDWALHFNTGISRAIRSHAPNVVVISGWDNPSYWMALGSAKVLGIPVVLWSGSHRLSGRSQRGPIRWLKERFVRAADAYLSYGSMAADYLVELGAPRDRIVVGSNAVESAIFASCSVQSGARERQGSHDKLIVLFSGQLIARKGLDILIRALSRASSSAHLWVIGNGPERANCEKLAGELLPGRAQFLGERQYAELPAIYAAADLFVMPSLVEVWGLVLNEAMASGLPVISSRQAGATADLVVGKETGLTFDATSIDDLAAQLTMMLGNPDLRARFGANGRELVRRLDTRRYAADFVKAAELALAVRAR